MKKWIALMAAVVMIFTLTACQTGDAPPQDEGYATVDLPPVDDDETWEPTGDESDIHTKPVVGTDFAGGAHIAELPADQLVLVYMNENDWDTIATGGGNETTPRALDQAVYAWRETHGGNADVKIRTVPFNEQSNTLAATFAGGETPDIVQLTDLSYPLWPARGFLEPLTEYRENLDLYNPEVFDADLMQNFKWNGHYFGTVNKGSTEEYRYYIIYNKTLFDRKGEVTPFEHYKAGNWNWTQFVNTARAMTEGTESFGFTSWGLFPYMAPYPLAILDEAGNQAILNIDDPNYVRYMTEVFNFYQTGSARNDWNLQEWRNVVPRGTDAMCLGSLGNMQDMVRTAARRDTGADLRIAPVPVFDPNGETLPKPYSYILGNSITSQAKAKTGAAEFLRLLSLVGRNQKEAEIADGSHWTVDHFNDEEKEMMEWYNTLVPAMDFVKGIGGSYPILDGEHFVGRIYYGSDEPSVQAVLEGVKPLLQAEFDVFNAR